MADENLKQDMEETVEDHKEEATEESTESAEEAAEETGQKEDGEAAADTQKTEGQAEATPEEEAGSDTKETKKSFFGKKKEKKDKKDTQIEELTDRLRRQMAEFDNFRKRTEKEKSAMFEVGAKSVVEKILPVVDNFERGLAAVPKEQEADPFAEGMAKIYKQFLAALEELGVKPIEAVGCEFDPNLHNAVMHIEDEGLEDNIVAEEFQKGYTYRDSVVRHSMVKVAN